MINTPDGDQPVEFTEVEQPEPAAHQAVVAVRAFSVNRGELALLAMRPRGWRPGQDVAGVVVEQAADGSGPQPGTRVVGMVDNAGWSESAAVDVSRLTELPDAVSMEQAAALPMAGLTALRTLRIGGSLLGRRVLVTGANGGVGRFHVQLAALSGAEVTAVTTKADQVEKELKALGATEVVPDVAEASGTFDLVEESVGGTALSAAVTKVAPKGTIVVLGASSGEKAAINVYDFFGHEGAKLVNYMSYAATDPTDADLRVLVDLVAAGKLVAEPGHVADWSGLAETVTRMRERALPGGKVVLTVG
ncbi:zinc-binding dehydrogenase [Saccharothrix variisporea]|uniref:zinc-binding dehydrogenase n=1 Tax=Saccharothrix variisporea TaxID=543527 RepID=UPI001B87E111|nr:zinc-binding dehydrogenase [Saccharothrix variisporea]